MTPEEEEELKRRQLEDLRHKSVKNERILKISKGSRNIGFIYIIIGLIFWLLPVIGLVVSITMANSLPPDIARYLSPGCCIFGCTGCCIGPIFAILGFSMVIGGGLTSIIKRK